MKGNWQEIDVQWKEHDRTPMQNERDMKGSEFNVKGTWQAMIAKWKGHDGKIKGTWLDMNAKQKGNYRTWMQHERSMKGHKYNMKNITGHENWKHHERNMQGIHAKWKAHERNVKEIKATWRKCNDSSKGKEPSTINVTFSVYDGLKNKKIELSWNCLSVVQVSYFLWTVNGQNVSWGLNM